MIDFLLPASPALEQLLLNVSLRDGAGNRATLRLPVTLLKLFRDTGGFEVLYSLPSAAPLRDVDIKALIGRLEQGERGVLLEITRPDGVFIRAVTEVNG